MISGRKVRRKQVKWEKKRWGGEAEQTNKQKSKQQNKQYLVCECSSQKGGRNCQLCHSSIFSLLFPNQLQRLFLFSRVGNSRFFPCRFILLNASLHFPSLFSHSLFRAIFYFHFRFLMPCRLIQPRVYHVYGRPGAPVNVCLSIYVHTWAVCVEMNMCE